MEIYRVIDNQVKFVDDFDDQQEAERFRDEVGGVIEIWEDGVFAGFY